MKENKKAKRKRILNSKKEKLLKMYYSGLSETYICERYRIPPSTFSGWIIEYRPYQRGSKFTSDETVNRNLTEKLRKEEAMLCIMSDFIKYLDLPNNVKYPYMDKSGTNYTIRELCDALQVDRGTYYNHLRNKDRSLKKEARKAILCNEIKRIFDESHGTYGPGRIQAALKKKGIYACTKYISNLAKEMGISVIRPKRERSTAGWNTRKTNLLLKGYSVTNINEVWVADITAFFLHGRTYYISVYLDLYSRMVLAYDIARSGSTQLVKRGLIRAYKERKPGKQLILHTDGGSQYDSWSMRRVYSKCHITHSFSRPAHPTDNPTVESFNATLKKEFLYSKNFTSERQLFKELKEYITFYNEKRIHRSLNDHSPKEFESILRASSKLVKRQVLNLPN